jgi:DNA repair and recombination protein RAD54B
LLKYFSVVWCKASKKKHKKWEGDAILIVRGRSFTLKDLEGKDIGRGIVIYITCIYYLVKNISIFLYN